VIFQENVSFDHYFGTYPNAMNPDGEPAFTAKPGTPTVNGLTAALVSKNPNSMNAKNGSGAVNPFRFSRSQAATSDQNHNYGPEQAAIHAVRRRLPSLPRADGKIRCGPMRAW
jgi:phospholipase C